MSDQRERSAGLPLASDVTATLAVAAFSLAVAAGYARVFSGWHFMVDMTIIVITGHGTGLLLRRTRWSGWVAVPVTAGVLVWVMAALFYRDTFSWGMPTTETWSFFRLELTAVRDGFRTSVAPVVYGGGWDALAAVGLGIAVVLADVFAFRALARAETLVPGGVLFVFVGALGDERLRVALTVVLVGTGVLTTVVLRSIHSPDNRRRSTSSLRRVVPAAVVAAIVVAVSAGLLGPRIPGADAAPIYETRGGGGGVTEVVSPLVDIRSRLTNRSEAELFQVHADVESYWRSAALSEFDGTIWGIPDQDLESPAETVATAAGATDNRQTITIVDLGGSLVPAAPDPREATGPSDLRWVEEASTLVTVDGDLEDGDVITIVSTSPQLDPAILAAATSDDPPGPGYTDLPDDLPSVVSSTALDVTAGSSNAFEASRLLQSWFQDEFDYSLEVQAGHGNTAIETFLHDRVGYCEQFAGTYAAMMRTLGVPARVAVGFTSGSVIAPDTYSVRGRNAHAWPEVWFDDIGWVAFEPTPGRGAPNAENYTGLAPQQDASEPGESGTASPGATPSTTIARGSDVAPGLQIPEDFADPTGAPTPTAAADTAAGFNWTPLLVVLALLLALSAPAIVRRLRTRVVGGSPDARLGRLWSRSVDAVRAAGVPVRHSDTPLETARATARHLPVATRPMTELANAVTEVTYRPEGAAGYDVVGMFGSSTMRQCQHWARQVHHAVDESSSTAARVRRYFTVWN